MFIKPFFIFFNLSRIFLITRTMRYLIRFQSLNLKKTTLIIGRVEEERECKYGLQRRYPFHAAKLRQNIFTAKRLSV